MQVFRVFLLTTLAVAVVADAEPVSTPSEVMAEFYSNQGAEDTLMDPLIVAGPMVHSSVIEAVDDPDMPLRRYAIAFLGNEEVSEALPVLRQIVEDDAELPYFRGDALEAIYKIDPAQAKELAQRFESENSALGRDANYVLEDAEHLKERRSLAKAKMRWHD